MKSYPRTDYTVTVRRQLGEEPPAVRHLYEGIYNVKLNHEIEVQFVPDVSAVAPPWDDRLLPMNLDDVTTVEQARLGSALFSSYVVTPNPARAGSVDRFELLGDFGRPGTVRYADPGEFATFSGELADLWSTVDTHSNLTVSDLRRYGVVRFIESKIATPGVMHPTDLYWLRDRAPSSLGGKA